MDDYILHPSLGREVFQDTDQSAAIFASKLSNNFTLEIQDADYTTVIIIVLPHNLKEIFRGITYLFWRRHVHTTNRQPIAKYSV